MNIVKKILFAGAMLVASAMCFAKMTNVMIVTGENNHNWRVIAPALAKVLTDQGDYKVDIVTDVTKLNKDSFKDVNVLISLWNSFGKERAKLEAEWSPEVKKAYSEAIKNGAGHVVVHASSDAFFPDWDDWRKFTLATWGGWVKDGKKVYTTHGKRHFYTISPTNVEHPITKGLPANMPSAKNGEMWCFIKVTNPEAQVIMTSQSDAPEAKTNEPQISAMVGNFGKGKCFVTFLGHGRDTINNTFATVFVRGVEWVANKPVKYNVLDNKEPVMTFDTVIGQAPKSPKKTK